MSKRKWFASTAPVLVALTGMCAALATGCTRKKTEGEGAAAGGSPAAGGQAMPGVTATEIKIGQAMPYSGPASAYGVIGKGDLAYFQMINDKGGINGRKVNLVSLDDGYNPAKAVEQTHKLVENDGVALVFNSLGTANNTAVQKYLNEKQIPQLFVATGADKWGAPKNFPWTMGWQPSYRQEAKVYAVYLLKNKPTAKLCVLYQNDDFGKDYLVGLREGLGDQYDKLVVKTASYEVTDPTVDSQLVALQGAGCDALLSAATPKFGAQAIRKVYDLGWKPFHMISNVSISRAAVLQPAGLDKSTGVVTAAYLKDPSDPRYDQDPAMTAYRAWVKQYLPGIDPSDGNALYAYAVSGTFAKVLAQCGNDLSRANLMKQAASLSNLEIPVLLSGVVIHTSADDFRPISQMALSRFNGQYFEPIGDLITAD